MQKIVQNKKQKGITLVALIITVIIMLILAGIVMNMIIGDNGIFKKSEEAKQIYTNEQEKEKKGLDDLYSKMLIATDNNSQITVNIEDLRTIIKQETIKNIYPVGSIYISTSGTNPKELFGGEWESYGEGRTLIGAGTGYEAGATGGSETVTLAVNNLPSHTHDIPALTGDTETANITGSLSPCMWWSDGASGVFSVKALNKNVRSPGRWDGVGRCDS